jgi:hypothetical protein
MPLTEDDLNLLAAIHAPGDPEQPWCQGEPAEPWPCDSARLIAELRASQAEARRLREHLQTIRDKYGKVCDGYELCHHTACDSSAGAWFEADAALAETAPAPPPEGT